VLVAEQPLGGEQARVLGEVLAVHDEVLPVHVDLDVRDPAAGAQRVDDVQRHADVAHEDLHRGLGVLVLEQDRAAVLGHPHGRLPDAVDEPLPALRVGRLEGIVVALDPRPDDETRPELAGEVGRVERELQRLRADAVVGEESPPRAKRESRCRPLQIA